MANPQQYSNAYGQQQQQLPPLNTSNPQYPQYQHQQHQQQSGAYSPPSYQNSPSAMSPTGGFHPSKRQRLSPNPQSPYQSPFGASPYANSNSPYAANSPPGNPYLSLPQSPAGMQGQHAFHQPQPYQQPPPQGSMMPPPKVPYSKAQDNTSELEKANKGEMDPNLISDVLTGSGIDLRAEEDNLLHNFGSRPAYGGSFNSQASASTMSPHGSFNQWGQATQGHGAYQGTGPLSQPLSQEQQEQELLRKYEEASRAFAESAQAPLNNPFLQANVLRHRIAKRVYEYGVKVNLDGVFDKIPDMQNLTRTTATGPNGESVSELRADSVVNGDAPFVEILSLITLATEERIRAVLEDSMALKEIRRKTSHGLVPHDMQDLVKDKSEAMELIAPFNLSNTPWEAPDSAVSPMTQTASKHPLNAARLPTPPTETPTTPQPTKRVTNNPVVTSLKRCAEEAFEFEKKRAAKRTKREQTTPATPSEPVVVPTPSILSKGGKSNLMGGLSKKQLSNQNKTNNTDDAMHAKANETANMALGMAFGGKKTKKYAWMTNAGGGSSGTSTPRITAGAGGATGANTPAQTKTDEALNGRKRHFGEKIEEQDINSRIQLRDLIHVLEDDGKERKTLITILARLRSTEKDEKKRDERRQLTTAPIR